MDIAVSIIIDRPVEVVYAYVSDYEHDSLWRAGIIGMTRTPPGRTQVGTKTREIARFFGIKRVTPAEITYYEHNSKVVFAGLMSNSIPVSGSRTVEPIEERTRFIYQVTVELSGFYRFIEPLMTVLLRRRFMSDLRHLKESLEVANEK